MKWLAFPLFFLLSITCCRQGVAQCGSNDFTIPSQVCEGQNIRVQPTNMPDSVEWDFCSRDFESTPVASPAFQISTAVGRPSLDLVKVNNVWFGFVTGTWTNSLKVLKFADGLDEAPTQVTSFGDLDGKLNNPGAIRIIQEQGVWYGIIHNTGSAEILKLTFDAGFEHISNVAVLTSGVGNINSGLALGRDATEGWVGIISEPGNTFTIIRFGFDLHSSLSEDIMETAAVPNPNNLGDVDLINVCGEWFAAAVNLGGGNTYLLRFGSNLFSIPRIDQIADLSVLNGARVRFAQEGSDFFLFVASLDGLWHVLKFGASINTNPIVENQHDLNGTLVAETYGLALAKENSKWTIFVVAQNNGQVYHVKYEQPCSTLPATSTQTVPLFNITSAGTYWISMKAYSNGTISNKSRSITVLPQAASDIAFVSQNVCAGHNVLFTSSNVSADVGTYQWDFGDATTSLAINPAHTYDTPGTYAVNLRVTSNNGCTNDAFKSIPIFSKPLADFGGVFDLLCTHGDVLFPTTTPDIYDGNLTYHWFVDDLPAGTNRDLQYTFTTTGAKDIKLITTIPGCSDEITKTTSPVESGPVVEFSYTGICEDDTFSFQSLVTDPVEGYLWNFGNGSTSASTNPDQLFADYGNYPVSLTVTNAIGCHNKKTKTIAVHALPVPDFTVNGPPNACSGIQTQFQDGSTSPDGAEITAWLWDFDDPGEPAVEHIQDAEHAFAAAGSYNVSLTSSTDDGCQATTTKQITIQQSPATAFSHSTACKDAPVLFSPPEDNTITSWYWEIGTSYYTDASPLHTFKSPADYPLYLEVTATNGCTSSVRDVIHIPVPLTPSFSALKNCVGEEAVLEDMTKGDDPVTSQEWSFDSGEAFTGSPVMFIFQEQATRTITLKVTAESGCSYAASKQIKILLPPVAGFAAEPASGAYPLEVKFGNTSSGATEYSWKFDDGGVSSETSPIHIFSGPGSYNVELTALNDLGCDAVFVANIGAVAPLPDVDIEMISLTPNGDGSMKLIVTLNNKGNTVLRDLPLELDFGGTHFTHILEGPIAPMSKFNFVFGTAVGGAPSIDYICVSADLADDLSPAGNRRCAELADKLFVFPAFPNPAADQLNVEWLAPETGSLRISVMDVLGRIALDVDAATVAGLNRHTIDVSGLGNGIYYLMLRQGDVSEVQRIAVSGRR